MNAIKMATAGLAENTHPDTLFGKVHRAADLVTRAHDIYKAARWDAPHVMTGLRGAAAFL